MAKKQAKDDKKKKTASKKGASSKASFKGRAKASAVATKKTGVFNRRRRGTKAFSKGEAGTSRRP
jgi:hypothetical protein